MLKITRTLFHNSQENKRIRKLNILFELFSRFYNLNKNYYLLLSTSSCFRGGDGVLVGVSNKCNSYLLLVNNLSIEQAYDVLIKLYDISVIVGSV